LNPQEIINSEEIINSALEFRDYILAVLDVQAKNYPESQISFFRLYVSDRGTLADVLLTLHVGLWDKKAGQTIPDAAQLPIGPRLAMFFDVLHEFILTWQHCRTEPHNSNEKDIKDVMLNVDCFKSSQLQPAVERNGLK
jgi:hypothetical protein